MRVAHEELITETQHYATSFWLLSRGSPQEGLQWRLSEWGCQTNYTQAGKGPVSLAAIGGALHLVNCVATAHRLLHRWPAPRAGECVSFCFDRPVQSRRLITIPVVRGCLVN